MIFKKAVEKNKISLLKRSRDLLVSFVMLLFGLIRNNLIVLLFLFFNIIIIKLAFLDDKNLIVLNQTELEQVIK